MKTYRNDSGSKLWIRGEEVQPGGTITSSSYLHYNNMTLLTDTDPTELVEANGNITKDTAGTETINITQSGIFEVQISVETGEYEVYFNDASTTPVRVEAGEAWTQEIDARLLKSIILKAVADSSECHYNVIHVR